MSDFVTKIIRQIAREYTEIDNPVNSELVQEMKQAKSLDSLNSDTLNRQIASLSTAQLEELINRGGMLPDNVQDTVMEYLYNTKKHKNKLSLKAKQKLEAKLKNRNKLKNDIRSRPSPRPDKPF